MKKIQEMVQIITEEKILKIVIIDFLLFEIVQLMDIGKEEIYQILMILVKFKQMNILNMILKKKRLKK